MAEIIRDEGLQRFIILAQSQSNQLVVEVVDAANFGEAYRSEFAEGQREQDCDIVVITPAQLQQLAALFRM